MELHCLLRHNFLIKTCETLVNQSAKHNSFDSVNKCLWHPCQRCQTLGEGKEGGGPFTMVTWSDHTAATKSALLATWKLSKSFSTFVVSWENVRSSQFYFSRRNMLPTTAKFFLIEHKTARSNSFFFSVPSQIYVFVFPKTRKDMKTHQQLHVQIQLRPRHVTCPSPFPASWHTRLNPWNRSSSSVSRTANSCPRSHSKSHRTKMPFTSFQISPNVLTVTRWRQKSASFHQQFRFRTASSRKTLNSFKRSQVIASVIDPFSLLSNNFE